MNLSYPLLCVNTKEYACWPPKMDGIMMESSDKTWSTGEQNGTPLQYSCLENPMNSMKGQKDMILKDELPRLVSVQYATREE